MGTPDGDLISEIVAILSHNCKEKCGVSAFLILIEEKSNALHIEPGSIAFGDNNCYNSSRYTLV